MANEKISDLTEKTEIGNDDFFVIVDSDDNTNKKITAANVKGTNPSVYRALLTQTGTNAPVATVLENTLGGVPVWYRDTNGVYFVQLNGFFPSGKTFVLIGNSGIYSDNTMGLYLITSFIESPNRINIYTNYFNFDGGFNNCNPYDGALSETAIQILVYP